MPLLSSGEGIALAINCQNSAILSTYTIRQVWKCFFVFGKLPFCVPIKSVYLIRKLVDTKLAFWKLINSFRPSKYHFGAWEQLSATQLCKLFVQDTKYYHFGSKELTQFLMYLAYVQGIAYIMKKYRPIWVNVHRTYSS